jgi:RHS repeat-associated protein
MATYRYTNTGAASLKLNERPVYGSSRLGSLRTDVELHTLPSYDPAGANPVQQVDLNYELTDHLGNVCAVVTGRLLDGNGGGTAKQAELVSAQGYEPFGSLLPGRNYSSDSYRFGFNGKEKVDDLLGSSGSSYDFGDRFHDPRIGRWLSLDPKAKAQAGWSPYKFGLNNPILFVDPDGQIEFNALLVVNKKTGEAVLTVTTANRVMTDGVKHPYNLGGLYYRNHYYDYANVTTIVINEDGTITESTYTVILYGNKVKDTEIAWFGDNAGETKKETWLNDPDIGVERSFGIEMSGGGDGPIGQDWTKNSIGEISFGDISMLLKRSSISKEYTPGTGALPWKKLINKDAKAWIETMKSMAGQGTLIGDIINKVSDEWRSQEITSSSDTNIVDSCVSCHRWFTRGTRRDATGDTSKIKSSQPINAGHKP